MPNGITQDTRVNKVDAVSHLMLPRIWFFSWLPSLAFPPHPKLPLIHQDPAHNLPPFASFPTPWGQYSWYLVTSLAIRLGVPAVTYQSTSASYLNFNPTSTLNIISSLAYQAPYHLVHTNTEALSIIPPCEGIFCLSFPNPPHYTHTQTLTDVTELLKGKNLFLVIQESSTTQLHHRSAINRGRK